MLVNSGTEKNLVLLVLLTPSTFRISAAFCPRRRRLHPAPPVSDGGEFGFPSSICAANLSYEAVSSEERGGWEAG